MIQRLERYNDNIATYVGHREVLAPSSKQRPKSSLADFDLVREQACGLYEALEDGWHCSCLDFHNANLQLGRWKIYAKSPSFKIFFSFQTRSSCDRRQEAWQEVQVSISEISEQRNTFTRDGQKGSTAKIPNTLDVPTISVTPDTVSIPKKTTPSTVKPKKTVRVLDQSDGFFARDQALSGKCLVD